MPKTALILEDDESQAKALQALCQKLGVEASIVRNGKEGLDQASREPPDLVLLDLLLPGLDGFKVADGLKAARVHSSLLVVTGVYKDAKVAKEFADRFGAEVFHKPYKADELSAAIARRLGLAAADKPAAVAPRRSTGEAPAVVPPQEGALQDKPFAALLMELSRAKASGTLELTQGQIRKRLYLYCGLVRFAQSNVKAENVGGMQVAEGTLSEERFRAALARARDERIGVGEALALAGDLSYEAVSKATRRQVEEVCVSAFAWQQGAYKFAPGPTDKIQDARHDPLVLLCAAYKRHAPTETARARLVPLARGTVGRSPEFDRALFTMRSVFPGETVTPMINGRLTIGEVVARARPEDLPLLLAAIELQLATVSGVELEKGPAAPRAAAPSRPYTPEELAARESILQEHERAMAAPDLFGVLRLPRGASIEEVKQSYLALAKRFHADTFSGLELGEAADALGELFAKISEAHATLGDARRRADYDVLLERKEAGLPTDMEVIFRAEAAFNRGDALIKQGRFGEAEGCLKEALKLDPSVAQYHVALAQALLKGRGAAGLAEAHEVLQKALGLNPEHNNARLMMAQVLEQEGDPRAALKLIDEVLAADPASAEANREYRAIRERMKKGPSRGLLDKLFKR